jgi:hypothetical protein
MENKIKQGAMEFLLHLIHHNTLSLRNIRLDGYQGLGNGAITYTITKIVPRQIDHL